MHKRVKSTTKSDKQSSSVEALFELGFMNHQQGQIENARQIYQQVLTLKPNHFNSLHLTGVIEYQKANYEKSIELYQKAITFNSSNAACFYNLGN